MKGYKPLIILMILFNVSITSGKAQSEDEDPHVYLGVGMNHFFKVQDNMKAFLYQASFADMKDLNEFDLSSSFITPAINLGASIPINEYLDYDFFFSRNYLKTNIEYENLKNQMVSRNLKLRTSSFGLLGIRYKFNTKASFGFNFPLVTAKLLYKSKNIESENSKYEVISTKQFMSHYTSIDLNLIFQYNITKLLTFRLEHSRSIFAGDVIFTTANDMVNLNPYRTAASILVKI